MKEATQPEIRQPENSEFLGDIRFKELSKLASRIEENLQKSKATAEIRFIGCFHVGNLDNSLLSAIQESDIITTELPTEPIRDALEGVFSEVTKKNPFWFNIIKQSLQNEKIITGVNRNKAVLSAEKRINSVKSTPYKNAPDIVLGIAKKPREEIFNLLPTNLKDNFGNQSGQMTLVTIESGQKLKDLFSKEILRGKMNDCFRIKGEIVRLVRSISSERQIKILITDLPLVIPEALIWAAAEYSADYLKPLYDNLSSRLNFFRSGACCLLRAYQDKSQLEEILGKLDVTIKNKLYKGELKEGSNIVVTHIGGQFHNPNLIKIAERLFPSPKSAILIENQLDKRMLPTKLNLWQLFGETIDPIEAVLSISVVNDEVLLNNDKALNLIFKVVKNQYTDLQKIALVEEMMKNYPSFKKEGKIRKGLWQDAFANMCDATPFFTLIRFRESLQGKEQVNLPKELINFLKDSMFQKEVCCLYNLFKNEMLKYFPDTDKLQPQNSP